MARAAAIMLLAVAMIGAMAAAAAAQPSPPDRQPSAPPGVAAPQRPLPPLSVFQTRFRANLMQADTDHDGRISLREWMVWRAAHPGRGGDAARQFQRMDLNHDGYLTPDEIDATSARAYERRAGMQGAPDEALQAPRRSIRAPNPVARRPAARGGPMMAVEGLAAAGLLLIAIIVLGVILDRRRR